MSANETTQVSSVPTFDCRQTFVETLIELATADKRIVAVIGEHEPDVVCLQELKSPNDRFPRTELERAGYGAVWHGQKSWNGVAILAKGLMPLLTRRCLPGDLDDTHSRYIEAAVDGILIGCSDHVAVAACG